MFGTIPDPLRVVYHKNIHQVLADLNLLFYQKMLVILDGIVAMEGNGPLFGNALEMNLLIAGDNPYLVDTVAARIMGFKPSEIPHLVKFAEHTGLSPDAVRSEGEDIDRVMRNFEPAKPNYFVKTEGYLMRYRWVVKLLFNEWFRRNITYRINPILTKARGGSFSWYIQDNDGKGREEKFLYPSQNLINTDAP